MLSANPNRAHALDDSMFHQRVHEVLLFASRRCGTAQVDSTTPLTLTALQATASILESKPEAQETAFPRDGGPAGEFSGHCLRQAALPFAGRASDARLRIARDLIRFCD
jgi:hypothetical protein